MMGAFYLCVHLVEHSSTFLSILTTISPRDGLGQIGDFTNGILAPLISLISVFLLYMAFKQQYRANDLFYNFEVQRSYQNEVEWLRQNSSIVHQLENTIRDKTAEELQDFLNSPDSLNLRMGLYMVNTFQKLFNQLTDGGNLTDSIRNELHQIFTIFYLPFLKQIFRDLTTYLVFIVNEGQQIDHNNVEIKFLVDFSIFYENHLRQLDNDQLFYNQLQLVQQNIEQ